MPQTPNLVPSVMHKLEAYRDFWSAADCEDERMSEEEAEFLTQAIEALAQAESVFKLLQTSSTAQREELSKAVATYRATGFVAARDYVAQCAADCGVSVQTALNIN